MEKSGHKGENGGKPYRLKLYIKGTTPLSSRAVVNIRRLCDEHLADRYNLEVVDVTSTPGLAKELQLIAVPTLIKEMPLPQRRFVGDMSATDRLFSGLGLERA